MRAGQECHESPRANSEPRYKRHANHFLPPADLVTLATPRNCFGRARGRGKGKQGQRGRGGGRVGLGARRSGREGTDLLGAAVVVREGRGGEGRSVRGQKGEEKE